MHDKEPDMKEYANMHSSAFIAISGPTNCGKSSTCKNIIVHKNKMYTVCLSLLGEYFTKNNNYIDCEMLREVRDATFDRNDRDVFIVEDCDIVLRQD